MTMTEPSSAAVEAAMEHLAGYCFVGNARGALSAASQADPALGLSFDEICELLDHLDLREPTADEKSAKAKLERSLKARQGVE